MAFVFALLLREVPLQGPGRIPPSAKAAEEVGEIAPVFAME